VPTALTVRPWLFECPCLVQEVEQASYEIQVSQAADGDPSGFGGVGGGDGLGLRVREIDGEVEDHEVVGQRVVAEALHMAQEGAGANLQAGLLGDLSYEGLGEALTGPDPAPGE
jgi:hypothetical protein